MKKKTPTPNKPQDLTDYGLRGIRNDIAALDARVKALEDKAGPSQHEADVARLRGE